MTRLLLLPITLPLRVAALQLRLAREAVDLALGMARELAPAPPSTATADDRPPPARTPTPGSAAEAPARPRPRRTARKATAARPARRRRSGPTTGEAAAIRAAQRESEAGAGGPGPELRLAEPWDGYDAMRLDEVLERLQDADPTQLAVVRLYESQHENRHAILLATATDAEP
jgi:hypothetical protein